MAIKILTTNALDCNNNDEYAVRKPKYTKVKVPGTQDKHCIS